MKNKVVIGVLAFICILCIWGILTRNRLVDREESVKNQWANVESQYQRRADLIPNLVNVVKGYVFHENSTLIDVVNARSKATQITVNLDNLADDELEKYSKAQGEISSAIGRLLMVRENYPELKANQNFLDLQVQLEGTENRIAVERMRYNKAVKEYNASTRQFPALFIAKLFDFPTMSYFEADKDSETAGEVEF